MVFHTRIKQALIFYKINYMAHPFEIYPIFHRQEKFKSASLFNKATAKKKRREKQALWKYQINKYRQFRVWQ